MSPASSHVSPYYIEKAVEDTSVPNLVTAVLADYRGYDTMFETIVIFTAGIACIFLLRTFQPKRIRKQALPSYPHRYHPRIEKRGRFPEDSVDFERIDSVWVPHDLIVKTTCRLIVPFIQIFALYVIAHGHHSPGGGFQGGVILGAAMIFLPLPSTCDRPFSRMGERSTADSGALGVFIYAGTGVLCMLLGIELPRLQRPGQVYWVSIR